jgi:hypothetical protein
MDPSMMGGAPPAGTPVTLNLEDLQAIVSEIAGPKEEDSGRVSNKDLGASVEALTQTVNAMAAAMGIDPAAATQQNPAEAASAMANEPVPELGPEEAAMAEVPAPPVDAMPPVDPALMQSAAAQGTPMPAPMMQMTAADYMESAKPSKNRIAHMLLNLKSVR